MSITQWGGRDSTALCREKIKSLEKIFSVTKHDSLIYCLNEESTSLLSKKGLTKLSPSDQSSNPFFDYQYCSTRVTDKDLLSLLDFSLSMARVTGGAFNPSLRAVSALWGFTEKSFRVPHDSEILHALDLSDYKKVSIKEGVLTRPYGLQFDLGGVAKGYAGDKIVEILEKSCATGAIIDLGGNIVVYGVKDGDPKAPFLVGIRDPKKSGLSGVLKVFGTKHIVTSGGYERFFISNGTRYCHIIGKDGRPVSGDLLSATVISDNGALSDALSTALFVMGSKEACAFAAGKDFDYILITDNGIITSDNLDFFPLNGYRLITK